MRFSIITINYNNCEGLKRTITSVVDQVFKDFEWIVVDGGSLDGSKELIEQFASFFSYWISEPDNGVYNAMNKGVEKAKGDYVIFMNSGDGFADSNVLLDVAGVLDCDIVAGCVKDNESGIITKAHEELSLWPLFHKNIPHQAEFIRKRLFYEIALYSDDLRVLADWEFNIRATLHDCSYKKIDRLVAFVEPGGISNTEISLMREEEEIIKEKNLPLSIRKDYVNWTEKERFLSLPYIEWAKQKVWPLRLLRFLFKFFG